MKTKNSESGQTLIEFILCFSFSFVMVFMFASLALNVTVGYLAHYATFMASRAYLVADSFSADSDYSSDDAKSNQMFEYVVSGLFKVTGPSNFLMKTPGPPNATLRKISDSGNGVGDRARKVFVGAYFNFSQKLIYPGPGGNRELNLVSESYLGKEPTRGECLRRMRTVINELTGPDTILNNHATLFDDGC
ncbi:MAG: hypothetical protein HQK50_04290 [Oligoflexia bacterium]|nr:hypothetical protein [Oligoflexia bacterium]MBF0364764.1 hypothetical protein [Oligoflexia bacterium]